MVKPIINHLQYNHQWAVETIPEWWIYYIYIIYILGFPHEVGHGDGDVLSLVRLSVFCFFCH